MLVGTMSRTLTPIPAMSRTLTPKPTMTMLTMSTLTLMARWFFIRTSPNSFLFYSALLFIGWILLCYLADYDNVQKFFDTLSTLHLFRQYYLRRTKDRQLETTPFCVHTDYQSQLQLITHRSRLLVPISLVNVRNELRWRELRRGFSLHNDIFSRLVSTESTIFPALQLVCRSVLRMSETVPKYIPTPYNFHFSLRQ